MPRTFRVLLFSSLFPSSERPGHGVFVETRLRELLKSGRVDAKVVAPVPWFPFRAARFGTYAQFAATPAYERRDGVDVHHPRYLLPPKIGMNVAPYSMACAAWPRLRHLQREGFDFDLIDAHYYYPDGVAASLLAGWLNKPFVVTARGTDLNVLPAYPTPRRLILSTARRAAASIGVSQALMDVLASLGADTTKLHTLRNGVDLQRFRPEPQAEARRKLDLPAEGRLLLSVGNLIELKGHHIAIEALASLPRDVHLVIVGAGPDQQALMRQCEQGGLASRVRFAGRVAQADLRWWYSAADALVLCSSREGWPNVLLEAMACGTPVLATRVSGTPDMVNDAAAGVLLESRSSQAVVAAWGALSERRPARAATRAHAELFSWDATTEGQLALFDRVVPSMPAGRAMA